MPREVRPRDAAPGPRRDRFEREARALRANLRRRKEQVRNLANSATRADQQAQQDRSGPDDRG